MTAIELARKAAALGDQAAARQAYELAINDQERAAPADKLEAAVYILQSGGDYRISYTCFRDLYNAGHLQREILPLMSAAFYEPNEKSLRSRYARNRRLLGKYPYLFRRDLPPFEDLPVRFFPYDEENGYVPFYRDTMLFGDYVNFSDPVVSRNFFKDLDKPILATDVFSQYELEYLRDNVRKSEYVGRENHVYLHYTDWAVFCSYLQVLDLRPLLKEEKLVFLFGDEISRYPIDFKERYGIDYSRYPVKPLGLREINRLIWHVQLSTHNGGDFFNEIFDTHPNLLFLTSIMMEKIEDKVAEWRKVVDQFKGQKNVEVKLRDADSQIVRELCALRDPTDKDIFVALYLTRENAMKFVDPASRIVPAIFFQPHFSNIIYTLKADRNDRAVLESEEDDRIRRFSVFRDFKYIKTFTPIRRFTTSHGGTVQNMYWAASYGAKKRREGTADKNKAIDIVGDAVSQRVVNRSFMVDPRDRLRKDAVAVRFEDAKLNTKATFTALAAFLDLPYDPRSMTSCTENGEPLNYRGYIVDGFDTATVYKTHDDFVNDSERKYIEYFLRDAYEFYGYDFQYYDGRSVTMEQVREWLNDFTTIDRYIRESWKEVYGSVESHLGNPETAEERRQRFLDEMIKGFHENREKNSEFLMRCPQFINRGGQPLRMMPLLEPDPALLEQPLYH